jgi:hypothetical protein
MNKEIPVDLQTLVSSTDNIVYDRVSAKEDTTNTDDSNILLFDESEIDNDAKLRTPQNSEEYIKSREEYINEQTRLIDIQKKFKVILKPTGENGRYTKLQESEIIIALSEVKLENDKYIYDKNVLSLKDKDDSEYDKIEIETNTSSDETNKDEEVNANNTVMIYIDKRDIGGVEFTEEEKSKLSLTSEIILNAVSNKRIEYNNVKKPAISAKEKLREANFSKVSTPVAFPISGFKADVQGFTGGELADIMLSVATTSADLFNKKVSIMYRKIKPLNRKPFESFDDFISNFSYITDLDIAVWAALVSNSLEKETMVITCADCGKKYKQTYVPRELPMFEAVDKTVLNELEKVSTMVDTDDYDSIISRSKIISFEDSGVDVMFGIASLKEYMISNPVIIDVLERVQKEHSGYELTELEIMLFSLFIRGVRFKSAESEWYTDINDIVDILYSLSISDYKVIKTLCTKMEDKYKINYGIHNSRCTVCGYNPPLIEVPVSDLVFSQMQMVGASITNLETIIEL